MIRKCIDGTGNYTDINFWNGDKNIIFRLKHGSAIDNAD
jgi:hypothetical protein